MGCIFIDLVNCNPLSDLLKLWVNLLRFVYLHNSERGYRKLPFTFAKKSPSIKQLACKIGPHLYNFDFGPPSKMTTI